MTEGAARQHGERQAGPARHREAPTLEPSAESAAPAFLGPDPWVPSAAGVLRLQELVGNRVVGRLMRSPLGPGSGAPAPFGGVGVQRQDEGATGTTTDPAPAAAEEDSHQ